MAHAYIYLDRLWLGERMVLMCVLEHLLGYFLSKPCQICVNCFYFL